MVAGLKIRSVARVFTFLLMAENMKENGKTT